MKTTVEKRKKEETTTIEKAKPASVQVLGAPELVLQRATPNGVSCVVRNARLTWVFVKEYREDRNDWRKGVKSVTLLIPKKGAGAFQRALGEAVKQCLALNKKVVSVDDKKAALQAALAVHAEGSLLKDGDQITNAAGESRAELVGFLTLQAKKTAFRESKTEEFLDRFPLILQDAAGRPVESAFVDREFYAGVYADVALSIAAYSVNGNSGVTVYLNGLRKVRDAERIGGFDPFAGIPIADGADLSYDDIPF